VAPALGLGLVVAGGGMALGLADKFAPGLGAIVAAAVLCIPEFVIPARKRRAAARDSAD
jgi:hypothetical protein